ncbi:MAG: putative zinc-binding metallopeptidase [Bacteroidales bacterium]|nr:putative zinc-binding metallopeptidase [Candidatus Sodaliphilus aphodohippi]
MKSIKLYLSAACLAATCALSLTSCSEDSLGESIFIDGQDYDPATFTYQLDKWCFDNYTKPYNAEFRYKMQDVGTNMNYNLVPASYDKSLDLAVLCKYLWYDVYNEVAGTEFLRANGPKIIHVIGSPAYNPTTGSKILGLAEGGIKISLYAVNQMNTNDFTELNENYFKTMHHEFTHILHQKKTYPVEFNKISNGHYDGTTWQDRQDGVVNSLGFVTTYASSATREDFAEIVANYIVKTDEQWDEIYKQAALGWGTPAKEGEANPIYYCWYYYDNNQSSEENLKYVDDWKVDTTYKDPYSTDTIPFAVLDPIEHQKPVEPTRVETVLTTENQFYGMSAEGDSLFKCVQVEKEVELDANNLEVIKEKNTKYVVDSRGHKIPIKVYAVKDNDGIDGVAALQQKIEIARDWLRKEWNVDLDKLRETVQSRQVGIAAKLKELRQQVLNVK